MSTEIILSDCIVIGFVNYGESDRIVKLYSSEKGLLSAIAKRVRSHKHKWAGVLEVGQTLEVKLSPPKNDLWLLKGVQEVANTAGLRKDLLKLSTMQYCCEITGALSIPEDPNPKLHGLLTHMLRTLNDLPTPGSAALNGFAIKALAISGHHAQLNTCGLCDKAIGTDRFFHTSLGAMVHTACLEQHPETQSTHLFQTPKGWANDIHNLLHQPMTSYWESSLSVLKNKKRSSTWLLTEMIEHTVERAIRSRSVLETLYP